MINDIFGHPHDDSLNFFATEDGERGYDEVMKTAKHIGWLSTKDFIFMESLYESVKNLGINSFSLHYTGVVKSDEVVIINKELDSFVLRRNATSRTDMETNYSVRRLRFLLNHSIQEKTDLYLVSD